MKKETVCSVFSKIPTVYTDRLILRRMKQTDAEDMFDYAKRQDVTKYLRWYPHQSVKYTSDYLRYVSARYNLGDFYDWAVVEKKSGKMIGTCGFTSFDLPNDSAEIGYVLNPDFHGLGYATEAAAKVIEFGFTTLDLHRIEARFMKENTASLRVMEKLGMTLEGYRRDGMLIKQQYRTIGVCSILKHEWQGQKEN